MLDTYADRWALVTGASSGIGAEFARKLASRGMHLVLAARRTDRMEEIAAELDTRHGTKTRVIQSDLSVPGAARQLYDKIAAEKIDIELLINNSGFAEVGTIEDANAQNVTEMVQVNIAALTDLTYCYLPSMLERGHGAVINVASVAAFQPVAYMGAYAASKAYVLHFSEALWTEAREKGVTVMALCPGPTSTEFFDNAGVPNWLKKHSSHSVEYVVKTGLKALEKKRNYSVAGWKNYLLSFGPRLARRRTVVAQSMRYFRPVPKQDEKKE